MKLVDVFNSPGCGSVRPGRPVEVDVHDVAGVSARPDRRPRGVRRDLRQQARRLVRPGGDRDRPEDPGARRRPDGFVKGFSSIAADTNADQALLYTGKAAMMLQGAWATASMKADQPKFVSSGARIRRTSRPCPAARAIPKNTVGNPANYFSISSKATDEEKTVGQGLLHRWDCSPTPYSTRFIDSGGVPVVKAARDRSWPARTTRRSCSLSSTWPRTRPTSSSPGTRRSVRLRRTALLNNIDQLFLVKITPEQFASAMNATIGK